MEVFEDDAKLLAAELDVTLTRRGNGKQTSDIPMAGVPYHAVENYVSRLLQLGYRVAIAEQTSPTESSQGDSRAKSVFQRDDLMRDRSSEKRTVDREVVRVLTPGTLIDPGMIDAKANNYLAAAIVDGAAVGLAYCDISTGEFLATEFTGQKALVRLEGELTRLQPAEVLVSDTDRQRPPMLQPAAGRLQQNLEPMRREERERLLPHERVARKVDGEAAAGQWVQGRVTPWPTWRWDRQTATDALKQQFRAASLDGFGFRDKPLALRAAGAVLQYLQETQRSAVAHIDSYFQKGTLLPDNVMNAVMTERLRSLPKDQGILLDGYPRTVDQAEALDPLLTSLNRSLTAVIALELKDEVAIHRLGGRRMCEGLGDPFAVHIDDQESVSACLRLGGRITTRPDDEPEVILERLRVYDMETEPLIGFYEQHGILHRISAAGSPEEVHDQIVAILQRGDRE